MPAKLLVAFKIEPVFAYIQAVGFAIVPKRLCPALILIIVLRSQNEPEIPAGMPRIQMLYNALHGGIIIDPDMMKAFDTVADGNRRNAASSDLFHKLSADLVAVPVFTDGMQIVQIKDHPVKLLRGRKRKNIVFTDRVSFV